MKIVKAEILWTRQCPLKCSYCSMADGRKNELSVEEWKYGMVNLKALGCGFAAFYGAEPLCDRPEDLAEVVGFAESIGIHTTVITSGIVPHVEEIVEMLYKKGARSLSTSYDIEACHKHAQAKTDKAIPLLNHFRSFGPVRDVAAIATVGEHNFSMMPEAVIRLSKENIWFFFDILHPDRGQPGSKCAGTGEPYLIKSWDMFSKILNVMMDLKESGCLCHTSKPFMKFIQFLTDEKVAGKEYYRSWNCGLDPKFPGWLTIDVDGLVYGCDDYQPRIYGEVPPITITEIYHKFDEFTKLWKPIIRKNCPGCLWNTHFDTFEIIEGRIPFSDYVHTKED